MGEKKEVASFGAVYRIYKEHALRQWLMVLLVFVGAIGVQAAALVAPLYMRQLFNILSSHGAVDSHTLYVLLACISATWIVGWLIGRIQMYALATGEAKIMASLLDTAFMRLLGHSHDFFASNFAGALTHKVNKFSKAFETLFDSLVMSFFPSLLFIVMAVGLLFINNHVIGLALAVWVIVQTGVQLYLTKTRQVVRAERAEADTRVTATLADAVSNHSAIQLFSSHTHEEQLEQAAVANWKEKTIRSWNFDMTMWGVSGFLTTSVQVVVLFFALHFWMQGTFSIGDFVLVQLYLFTTLDRLNSINREFRRIFDAFSDAAEMVAILERPYGVQDVPHAPDLRPSRTEIEFKDVCFHFNAKYPVLTDLNLRIENGEKIALVGPSGAGKSTITKLLLRLYDVSSGSIHIDGHDIAQVTQSSLRRAISFVPQEPVLFHRTLADNIRYGKLDATEEEVIAAAKKAHCHEFISRLSLGYETFVGERGIKLSGGERQRVAIARAILKDAPILVLDEATSSLDSESESLIQDALQTLMQGKTVIVIAHRLSTIMKMDRIVVIEGGKVAAMGTHDELLAQGGLYKKLWDIQAGGFLVDEDAETETEQK